MDLRLAHELDAVRVLMDNARRDIENKTWQKCVEVYIANLKKPSSDTIGCRQCGSRRIRATTVDEREMYECEKCGNIWYAPRSLTNGPLSIIDDITNGVETNGSHEIATCVLLNCVLRPADQNGAPFQDQLKNWALHNRLKYETYYRGEAQQLRFWR